MTEIFFWLTLISFGCLAGIFMAAWIEDASNPRGDYGTDQWVQ